jgi:hypothetical protein
LGGFPEFDGEFLLDFVVDVGLPVLAGAAGVVVEDALGDAYEVGLLVSGVAGGDEELSLHCPRF